MNAGADALLLFAVVSTLALGGAWGIASRARSLAAREAIWKAAVLLSLVLPVAYLGVASQRRVEREMISVRVRDPGVLDELGAPRLEARALLPGAKRVSPLWWRARTVIPGFLLGLGALNTLLLVGVWGRELRAIGRRRPLESGEALCRQLGASRVGKLRLTAAPGMGVPGVVGLREICIPEEDADRVDSDGLVAVVAHEAAHLERGDLLWLRLLGLTGAFFFYQPLLRVARRELIRVAEFQADELAVRRTGHRAPLVDALLVYAQRTGGGVREGTLAFATSESQLVQRARRILTVDAVQSPHPLLRWIPASAVVLALAGATVPLRAEGPLRRVRSEVIAVKGHGGVAEAPLVQAAQEIEGGRVDASITRAPDGSLVTEFRVDGEPVPATPEREAWLKRVLSSGDAPR